MNKGDRLISRDMWTTDDDFKELGGAEPAPGEAWDKWMLRKIVRQDVWTRIVGCAADDFGRFAANPKMLAQMFMLGTGGPGIDWYAGQIAEGLDEFERIHWIARYISGPPGRERQHGVAWTFIKRHAHRWSRASSHPPVPLELVREEARRRHLPPHQPGMSHKDMSYEKFESLQTWCGSMDSWGRAHPELTGDRGRPARRARGPKEFEPPKS